MPEIDFYLLEKKQAQTPERFIIRLIEKIITLNHRVFLCVNDLMAAQHWSDQFWSLPAQRIIPNQVTGFHPQEPTKQSLNLTASFDHYAKDLTQLSLQSYQTQELSPPLAIGNLTVSLAMDEEKIQGYSRDVIVNIDHDMLTEFTHCQRLAEIVWPADEAKQAARERYRQYKSQGFQVKTHTL